MGWGKINQEFKNSDRERGSGKSRSRKVIIPTNITFAFQKIRTLAFINSAQESIEEDKSAYSLKVNDRWRNSMREIAQKTI